MYGRKIAASGKLREDTAEHGSGHLDERHRPQFGVWVQFGRL
jgi:hypothetical protein